MRIKVVGESDTAKALRLALQAAGVAVAPDLVEASAHFTLYIEEYAGPNIVFDSVDCELERNILRHVSDNTPSDIVVRRGAGDIEADDKIKLLVPRNAQEIKAVEVGVLRGILDTVRCMGVARQNAAEGAADNAVDVAAMVDKRIGVFENRTIANIEGAADRLNHQYSVVKDMLSTKFLELNREQENQRQETLAPINALKDRLCNLDEHIYAANANMRHNISMVESAVNKINANLSRPWWKKLLGLLMLCVVLTAPAAIAQHNDDEATPAAVDIAPAPISHVAQIEILREQIKVYRRLIDKLRAELELVKADKDITAMNQRLDELEVEARKQSNATSEWQITETLEWKKKPVRK